MYQDLSRQIKSSLVSSEHKQAAEWGQITTSIN